MLTWNMEGSFNLGETSVFNLSRILVAALEKKAKDNRVKKGDEGNEKENEEGFLDFFFFNPSVFWGKLSSR